MACKKFFISSFGYQAVPINWTLAPAGNTLLYSFLLSLPKYDQIACLSEQVLLLAPVYRQETHVSILTAACPVQKELSI